MVADDANRIIFVNAAAGELLGWSHEALVRQRLTVVIPPEMREAHLAGFSRLRVTGVARILGSTPRVPALRRDGSLVDVSLTMEEVAGDGAGPRSVESRVGAERGHAPEEANRMTTGEAASVSVLAVWRSSSGARGVGLRHAPHIRRGAGSAGALNGPRRLASRPASAGHDEIVRSGTARDAPMGRRES